MTQDRLALEASEVFQASVQLAEKWTMLGFAAQAALWDQWSRPMRLAREEWLGLWSLPELPLLKVL